MTLIIYIILLIVAIAAPLKVQVVLFLLNLIIPDPIPFIDEILQFAFILRKIFKG
jgi:hypothetical protein